MKIRVLGGDGGGVLSDITVYLVGEKDSNAVDLLSQLFPNRIERRSDGSVALPIRPGGSTVPRIVDAVEIESPVLNGILVVGFAIVLIALISLFRK